MDVDGDFQDEQTLAQEVDLVVILHAQPSTTKASELLQALKDKCGVRWSVDCEFVRTGELEEGPAFREVAERADTSRCIWIISDEFTVTGDTSAFWSPVKKEAQLVYCHGQVRVGCQFEGSALPKDGDETKKLPLDAFLSYQSSRRIGFGKVTNFLMSPNIILRGGVEAAKVDVFRWLHEATTAAILTDRYIVEALPLSAAKISTVAVVPSPFALATDRATTEYMQNGWNIPRKVLHSSLPEVFTLNSVQPADMTDAGPADMGEGKIVDYFCASTLRMPRLSKEVHEMKLKERNQRNQGEREPDAQARRTTGSSRKRRSKAAASTTPASPPRKRRKTRKKVSFAAEPAVAEPGGGTPPASHGDLGQEAEDVPETDVTAVAHEGAHVVPPGSRGLLPQEIPPPLEANSEPRSEAEAEQNAAPPEAGGDGESAPPGARDPRAAPAPQLKLQLFELTMPITVGVVTKLRGDIGRDPATPTCLANLVDLESVQWWTSRKLAAQLLELELKAGMQEADVAHTTPLAKVMRRIKLGMLGPDRAESMDVHKLHHMVCGCVPATVDELRPLTKELASALHSYPDLHAKRAAVVIGYWALSAECHSVLREGTVLDDDKVQRIVARCYLAERVFSSCPQFLLRA